MTGLRRLCAWTVSTAILSTLVACGQLADVTDPPPTTREIDPRTSFVLDAGRDAKRDTEVAAPDGGSDAAQDAEIVPDVVADACAPLLYYRDLDGDGFGDDANTTVACAQPAGYVTMGGDCMDSNADAHPGQLSSFTTDRGDGSYDYDCDGIETQARRVKDPEFCVCGFGGGFAGCSASSGWESDVPACGATATWHGGSNGMTCDPITSTETQACR